MNIENVSNCPLCGSAEKGEFLNCKDHFVSAENFSLSICYSCGFCFTDPRPDVESFSRYYESDKYISHSKTSKGFTNNLFHLARKYTLRSKGKIVSKYSSGKAILDYGCGTGEFLSSMKKSGWFASGIEPSQLARDHAREKYGLEVSDQSGIEKIQDESIDVITLWHVLEHIYPLKDRVASFHNKLKKEGTLIVAVPNMNSYDAKRYGKFWAAYDVPRHIYHFTPETISSLMTESGFTHMKTMGMILDAFYISMLSEKYKHGSDKFFKAIFYGMMSNMNAFLGNGNYSSLIYIFKKSN